jgi:outer membrane protein
MTSRFCKLVSGAKLISGSMLAACALSASPLLAATELASKTMPPVPELPSLGIAESLNILSPAQGPAEPTPPAIEPAPQEAPLEGAQPLSMEAPPETAPLSPPPPDIEPTPEPVKAEAPPPEPEVEKTPWPKAKKADAKPVAEDDFFQTINKPIDDTPLAERQDEFFAALKNVYANHPQLKAQREALAAIDEGVSQAVSGFRPSATAGYTAGRERGTGSNDRWDYDGSHSKTLEIEQPIFSGGSSLAEYASAKDRVKAGRAELVALEQQVLLAAIVAYTDVVEKKSVLKVNQHNVDVLAKDLKDTNARFEVGELTRTDIAHSQARLASAKAAERQALGDLATAQATFKRLIGYEPPPSIALPAEPAKLPASVQEATLWAEANNPVLEAARHLENATQNDVDIRASSLFPTVSLQGNMTRRDVANSNVSRGDSDQVLLNVSIPLYQSGAEYSRIRAAKNLAQQAKFNAMDTKNGITEDATRAWQDYNTAKAIITSNEQAVKAAREALDSIRQENMQGLRTTLDVLNTEQDYFSARVELVKSTVAEKQQAYRLLAATGHLTAQDLKLPVDLIDSQTHYDDVKNQLIGF